MAQMKHWFLLAYQVQNPGLWVPHSVIMGFDTNELSIPLLNQAKHDKKVPEASVLLSVSYLGFMSERRINGQPDVDPPTVISDAYRVGMVAAAQVPAADPKQPVNPYGVIDVPPEEAAKAYEWQQGFDAVRAAQSDTRTPVQRIEPPTVAPTQPQPVGEPIEKPTRTATQQRK